MVVHCHGIALQMKFTTSFQENLFYLQNFGAIGVDIFFVVSGFIISYISRNESGPAAAKDFAKRRWIRIVPAYYLASIIFFCLLTLGNHFKFDIFQVIKTITILPLFDYGPTIWDPVLAIGWTLGFEFLFYILNVLLILPPVIKKDLWLILVIVALILLGIFLPWNNLQWRFVTNPMIAEFAFGVLVAAV